jgi:hypothetical protein
MSHYSNEWENLINKENKKMESKKVNYVPSRLDYFAASALQGICANPESANIDIEDVAQHCLGYAEAVIRAIDGNI